MANLSSYNAHEDFEILGYWFTDYKGYELDLTGTLYYTANDTQLDLHGTFSEDSFSDNTNVLPNIYGFSKDGKLLWLKNCHSAGSSISTPGFGIQSYTTNEFFIFNVDFKQFSGDVIRSSFESIFEGHAEDISVDKMTFSIDHLYDWYGKQIKRKFKKEEDYLNISFYDADTLKYDISLKDLRLITGVTSRIHPPRGIWKYQEHPYLRLQGNKQKETSLDDLLETARSIVKLIELFLKKSLKFKYIEFTKGTVEEEINGDKTTHPLLRGRYFYTAVGEKNQKKLNEVTLSLINLRDDFDSILEKWFKKEKKLEFIVDTYLSDFYLPYYISTQLVNSIRNLEIFHRNFKGENSNGNNQSNKDKFYLRERLRYVFESLPEKILIELNLNSKNSREKFITSLIETGNYYTHGDRTEKYPNRITDPSEMYSTNQVLRKICLYYIYTEIGIPEEYIFKAIR